MNSDFVTPDADAKNYFIGSEECSTVTYKSDETRRLRVSDTEPSAQHCGPTRQQLPMVTRNMSGSRERSTQGVRYSGASCQVMLLEVCVGTATVTGASRLTGLTVSTPVDKINDWDLCDRTTMGKLKRVMKTQSEKSCSDSQHQMVPSESSQPMNADVSNESSSPDVGVDHYFIGSEETGTIAHRGGDEAGSSRVPDTESSMAQISFRQQKVPAATRVLAYAYEKPLSDVRYFCVSFCALFLEACWLSQADCFMPCG